jgi:hypothetical protein
MAKDSISRWKWLSRNIPQSNSVQRKTKMFDREKVCLIRKMRLIRKQLEEHIAPLAKELGVEVDVVVADKDGQVLTPEVRLLGLNQDQDTFAYGGKQYKITSLATKKNRLTIHADQVGCPAK